MKDLTPLEAGRWLSAAPRAVQNIVTGPKPSQTAIELGKKYQLHLDVQGGIVKLIGYALVGYMEPKDFFEELTALGIPEKQAHEMMVVINEQIFVPLQKEIRGGSESLVLSKPQPPAPPIPGVPAARRPEIPGVQPEVRPGKEGSFFHLENKLPPPVPKTVPAPAVAPRPVAQNVAPVAPRPTPSAAPVAPSNRPGLREALAAANVPIVASSANRMLEDHEEPRIELGASDTVQGIRNTPPVPPKPDPVPLTPAPAPVQRKPYPLPLTPVPAPASAPVPQNLPGAMPPQVIPPGGRPVILQPKFGPVASSGPAAHAPSVPVTPPVTPRPIPPPEAKRPTPPAPKAYAVDPYREPFEEPGA